VSKSFTMPPNPREGAMCPMTERRAGQDDVRRIAVRW
jgi:hypothetical protein